jgi:hypothetical protein
MSRSPKKSGAKTPIRASSFNAPLPDQFNGVLRLIEAARRRAVTAVNTTLIDLYWNIGEYITRKIADDGWGQGTVEELAETIKRRFPNMGGYSAETSGGCDSFSRPAATSQNSRHR